MGKRVNVYKTEKNPDTKHLIQVATRMDRGLVKRMRIECAKRGMRLQEFLAAAVERELARKAAAASK